MNTKPPFRTPGLLSALLIMLLVATACAPIVTRHRMEISHETIPCPDSIRTTCLLVKIDTMEDWQAWPMARPIHGFEYQLGYSYDLAVEEVQKRNQKNPPWWRLVEVMAKEEFVIKPPRVAGTSWVLREFGPSGELQQPPAGTEVTLNIAEYGSLSGKSGCNRYFAEVSFPDTDRIQVSSPGATRMYCGEPEGIMELETSYLSLLSQAQSYHMEADVLTILCERDNRLIFDQVFE